MNFRLDEETIDALKEQSKIEGKTVTDILQDALSGADRSHVHESKIATQERRIKDLEDRITRLTGKAPARTKRLSISVTIEEHATIKDLAAKAGMTLSEMCCAKACQRRQKEAKTACADIDRGQNPYPFLLSLRVLRRFAISELFI